VICDPTLISRFPPLDMTLLQSVGVLKSAEAAQDFTIKLELAIGSAKM
jgi:hypothetical protein